ncbi:SPOR domain-containing protein [Cytobacillus spongiae]|uniref:SPOR domain-containing protein n=1 Tax=Cytobacillus spongiae TaxID=2901381 RepID=UPI001F1BA68F|nr:SPOR domain-containing protein [Cytobacillus spongiae]UII55042.1 SPOR domain-containing protein [Cytobacillus spongiae]
MDKLANGKTKTITIKINGKDRTFEDKQFHPQGQQAESDSDTKSVSFHETAASQEAVEDESFDWILPELDDDVQVEVKEYKLGNSEKKTKKKGISQLQSALNRKNDKGFLPSIFLAFVFAVLLGTSFGFIMLKLVITDGGIVGGTPTPTASSGSDESLTPGTAEATLQPIVSFVIQGGVYSDIEAAKEIQASINEKGIPSQIIEIDDQAYLFLGVADSLEDAKAIGTQLKSKGVDTYAKELSFGGASVASLEENEKLLLEQSRPLYQLLAAGVGTITLSNEIPKQLLDSIEKQGSSFIDVNPDNITNKNIQQMQIDLQTVMNQMISYQQKPEQKLINNMQQRMLSFLAMYHSM